MQVRHNCIGILGGGQLARMSLQAASRLGISIAILEKHSGSPAGMLTRKEFAGWVDNHILLEQFARQCDAVTLENEFIDASNLYFIETLGIRMVPSSDTIALIQDKYIQKRTMAAAGIPVPAFIPVTDTSEYQKLKKLFGKKFLLKSRKMGYDGYGNAMITSPEDYVSSIEKLTKRHSDIYAEGFVNFEKELAVMVVRTQKEVKTYPVVETIQENHICKLVLAPAGIPKKTAELAKQIAVAAVEAVDGFGIFGVELFCNSAGDVLVNEMAPRPHNSGHYTIEATVTSQFENHIRSVLGLPLGSTEMNCKNAVMINILGRGDGTGEIKNMDKLMKMGDFYLHNYGKKVSRPGRKMGHITLKGDDMSVLIKQAKKIERTVVI